MIRISNVKLPCSHTEQEMKKKVCRLLGLSAGSQIRVQVVRRSLDARKKPDLYFVYILDVETGWKPEKEAALVGRLKAPEIAIAKAEEYRFPMDGMKRLPHRPVIAGMGPAGLFCGYLLAEHGYEPIILERGGCVQERMEAVARFWNGGDLDPGTNVQFGEGGAGTFSDGKLNTLVKDKFLRGRKVLELFVHHGAPEEILWLQKPHIGTDILCGVVASMREKIREMGGEVRFHSCVTDIGIKDGRISHVTINGEETLACDALVLAVGHSARDTFAMLDGKLTMEPKSFAIGVRIEHPQEMINRSQYGSASVKGLGAADYKVTAQTSAGRGVYSFCMCPGGFVVNASSEPGRLAVNGMSNHARNERNANSALIVTVTPEDFGGSGALAGVAFQRRLEEAAYAQCGGKIPVQLYGDFKENRVSSALGDVTPCTKGAYAFGNLKEVLPETVTAALEEAMPVFGKKIHGFDREDAVLSGIESRTSSPLRIVRNTDGESSIGGLYPCGEGAGYAGGITSAAMDGIRIAEQIAKKYCPWENHRND